MDAHALRPELKALSMLDTGLTTRGPGCARSQGA